MAGRAILIVEDHPLSMEFITELLETAGYEVYQAEDGMELLQRVKQQRPALILLDLQLPGVDGFTLVRQLKADQDVCTIPVLAMSAHAMPEVQARALAEGCDGYFAKPFDTAELLLALARILGP